MKNFIKAAATEVAIPAPRSISLSAAEFQGLSDVPPESVWFASIESVHTRRAYAADIRDFLGFIQAGDSQALRQVKRAHVLAWRRALEARKLSAPTVRRKLSALASLFEHLCEANSVAENPVKGVKRPKVGSYSGKTPALGDHQARRLLQTPQGDSVKALRDQAMLSVFLYHGIRREELCRLRVKDVQVMDMGAHYMYVHGKGAKTRSIELHPLTQGHLSAYLAKAGHAADLDGPLFRPVKNSRGAVDGAITPDGVYRVVRTYLRAIGLSQELFAPHALRTTAATNALLHGADISFVQPWLGHASISTTKGYDRRKSRPEDSPTYKVSF